MENPCAIIITFPEPENRLGWGKIVEKAKKATQDVPDLKMHAVKGDAAAKVISFVTDPPPALTFEEGSLEEAVFQALGAASVCWDNIEGAGVFESTRAKEIGEALMIRIRREYPNEEPPYTNLGPECFTDGMVISYKGENYYKACGESVAMVWGVGQSSCVKRSGHPGDVHEDYDGRQKSGNGEPEIVEE